MTKVIHFFCFRVFVDVILNHMTSNKDNCQGTATSSCDTKEFSYPAVPYMKEHFNQPLCQIKDYFNITEVLHSRYLRCRGGYLSTIAPHTLIIRSNLTVNELHHFENLILMICVYNFFKQNQFHVHITSVDSSYIYEIDNILPK